MHSFIVHPVNPGLVVRVVRDMPVLPSSLDARIEALWTRAARRVEQGGAGRLFNGRVFSIDSITPDLILGHITEYRRVIAQAEDHTLFAELGIRSLSACGVLRCGDGVAIGRRPAAAVYQPGMWQLCPAGSIDDGTLRADRTMDYQAQLRTELWEELGVGPETLGPVTPLCVVEHPGSHVSDMGMMVETSLDGAAVRQAHAALGNGEYDPLRIVAVPDLPAFIDRAGDSLVPPAPVFLRHAGLIDGAPRDAAYCAAARSGTASALS